MIEISRGRVGIEASDRRDHAHPRPKSQQMWGIGGLVAFHNEPLGLYVDGVLPPRPKGGTG